MRYVTIDTETTGLFNFKLPADAPSQPRLAHLGLILHDDEGGVPEHSDHYAFPDGWTMPAEAQAINGLSTEYLREVGKPIDQILDAYAQHVLDGRVVVAFNAQFDLKVMRAELRRAGRDDLFERTLNICVMRPMTDICRIPHRSGPAWGFKFPKLVEALGHFGIVNDAPHTATADAHGAYLIFEKLRELGKLPEPAVHFAKAAAAVA